MQKAPTWKDVAWPTACLAFLAVCSRDRWEDNSLLFKVWIYLVAVYFVFSWINFLTKGKLTAWRHREKEMEVPDDFSKFCLRHSISPQLKLGLSQLLGGGPSSGTDFPKDLQISNPNDAIAICAAVKQAARESPDVVSSILPLFWNIGSGEAFGIFRELGMPLVHDHVKRLSAAPLSGGFNSDLFSGIKLLVGFAYPPSFPLVRALSRNAPTADKMGWIGAFGSIPLESKDARDLVAQWSGELPEAFASVAFLDWANGQLAQGNLEHHPFDTAQGMNRLKSYLEGTNEEEYSYARSATVALANLTAPLPLLAIASRHPDTAIRIEAEWVKAKRGDDHALDTLAEFCLDWRTRGQAARYLEELGHPDRIPIQLQGAREQAAGTMADWLKHPNELGALPDEMEVMDHREIHWPPADKKLPVTLLRWKLKEETGIGMAGSITWRFFGEPSDGQPVLDLYAKHCNWELQANKHPAAPEEYSDLAYGRDLLTKANPQEDWIATG